MSYQTIDRWCPQCASLTPHETDTAGRQRCVMCTEKRGPTLRRYETGTLTQHISALDGAGNRGELPRKGARKK